MTGVEMNILIVALYYYDDEEEMLLDICKNGVSAAHRTLLDNLIAGLSKQANLTLLTSLPIGSFPYMSNQIIVRSNRRQHNFEIGYINFPIVKDLIRCVSVKNEVIRWYKALRNKENSYVLIYDAILPFIKGAAKAKNIIKNIKNVLIIPDLPGKFSIESNTYNPIINLRLKQKAKTFYSEVNKVDAFIPLTKYMMKKIHMEKKPWLVMECIVKPNYEKRPKYIKKEKKIIMYAGELSKRVNLNTLLDSLKYINSKFELYICGSGEMDNEIKAESERSDKINYLGYIPKKQLNTMVDHIDIFVNPRQNNIEFTRYSFPSKNAEYLVTGKPVIGYRLDGIPEEYYKYMFLPKTNSPEDLASMIDQVIGLNDKILLEAGERQIKFMNSKSAEIQSKKIVNFLRGLNHDN